jgi:hypothetical protein
LAPFPPTEKLSVHDEDSRCSRPERALSTLFVAHEELPLDLAVRIALGQQAHTLETFPSAEHFLVLFMNEAATSIELHGHEFIHE